MKYKFYDKRDFLGLKDIGFISAGCLKDLEEFIKPDVTTLDIDHFVVRYAKKHNLTCATLGYRGFPASCCTSVNHVACHGIPSKDKTLKEGDIVKVDVTFIKDGYFGDTCRTFKVGEVSRKAELITGIAEESRDIGIKQCGPGQHIGEIGYAIQQYVQKNNASIVREFVGHGIGKMFHDGPDVPHFCKKENIKSTPIMTPGMVFTIEPIVNLGEAKLKIAKDGWTASTADRSLSAQFEHTIGITEDGVEIFTL
jgi:methionyl aminopeptidase